MCKGVVADFFAHLELALYQSRFLIRRLSNNEECGRRALTLKNVEDPWRPFRIRPIVECERHLVRSRAHLLDAPREWITLKALVIKNIAGRVVIESAAATLRRCCDLPDVAVAFENQIVA